MNLKGNGRGNGGRETRGQYGTDLAACAEEGGVGGETVVLGVAAVEDVATMLETFCLEEGDGLGGPELGQKVDGPYRLFDWRRENQRQKLNRAARSFRLN
jgi:hypothetical protein